MRTRNLPTIFFIVSVLVYTLWFFHDFPTRRKESILQRLTSADAVEIYFYDLDGRDVVVRVNEILDLARFSDIFEKSPLISIPSTKSAIFGRADYYATEKNVLSVEFSSLPIVLIDGRNYAVSPDFMILARALAEKGYKHE